MNPRTILIWLISIATCTSAVAQNYTPVYDLYTSVSPGAMRTYDGVYPWTQYQITGSFQIGDGFAPLQKGRVPDWGKNGPPAIWVFQKGDLAWRLAHATFGVSSYSSTVNFSATLDNPFNLPLEGHIVVMLKGASDTGERQASGVWRKFPDSWDAVIDELPGGNIVPITERPTLYAHREPDTFDVQTVTFKVMGSVTPGGLVQPKFHWTSYTAAWPGPQWSVCTADHISGGTYAEEVATFKVEVPGSGPRLFRILAEGLNGAGYPERSFIVRSIGGHPIKIRP